MKNSNYVNKPSQSLWSCSHIESLKAGWTVEMVIVIVYLANLGIVDFHEIVIYLFMYLVGIITP